YQPRVVALFDAVTFNADQGASLNKEAGMPYLIITAKHHDGFAMWPSKVTPYNIHDATKFQRDPMQELAEACRKNGIRFGFYYSHAYDWEDPDAPGNDWEYDNPGGDKQLHGGAQWYDQHPELLEKARRYVDRKAIPQIRELIAMYRPDILWFDTPQKLPLSEQLRILKAVRQADPSIIVNGRCARGAGRNFGDYTNTGDRAAEFAPAQGDWETIPTTNESYGYHQFDNSHKPPEYFIRLIARAAARGGNILLNIGPMGNGEIDPKDQVILRGIGKWMSANHDSIYGTVRTPLAVQAWGESTRRADGLYLHVFDWPRDGKLVVGGLAADIAGVRMVSSGGALRWRRLNDRDLEIDGATAAPDPVDSVISVTVSGGLSTNPIRLLSGRQRNLMSAYDAQLMGEGFRYTDGKAPHAYVYDWKSRDEWILWPARLNAPSELEVWTGYSTGSPQDQGRFAVELGDQRIEADIQPTVKDTEPREVMIGVLKAPAGQSDVRVRAVKIEGRESIRLFSLTLVPK